MVEFEPRPPRDNLSMQKLVMLVVVQLELKMFTASDGIGSFIQVFIPQLLPAQPVTHYYSLEQATKAFQR